MATFIDFHSGRFAPRLSRIIREGFYLASCFFLCFALVCVALLDSSGIRYASLRRVRRAEVEAVAGAPRSTQARRGRASS